MNIFHRTFILIRRLPIFPERLRSSIFGGLKLDCRVRNGNGYYLHPIITKNFLYNSYPHLCTSYPLIYPQLIKVINISVSYLAVDFYLYTQSYIMNYSNLSILINYLDNL